MSDVDALCDRIKMALAEVGYPDAVLIIENGMPVWDSYNNSRAADAAWWMACELAGPSLPIGHACWPCWSSDTFDIGIGQRCADGECSHPEGPRFPPRELLRVTR